MLKNYTQVAWVVYDLDRSIKRWTALGAGPFFETDPKLLPEREYRGVKGRDHIRTALTFLGTTQIELIQPTDNEPSFFREVLDKRGECVHHYQPNCRIIDAATFEADAKTYRDQGFEIAQSMVVPGMGRIVYFDALESMGVFFELAERPPQFYQNSVDMYEAHVGWDGKDPIRTNKMMTIAASLLK